MILVWSLISLEPPTYGMVQYPVWGLTLGWCMVVFILIWIPAVAVYKLMAAEGSPWKVFMLSRIRQEAFKKAVIFFCNFQSQMSLKCAPTFVILMLPYFLQRLKSLCSASEEWHPYLDINRGERYSKERCCQRTNNQQM